MVMLGRSVNLTALFLGLLRPPRWLTSTRRFSDEGHNICFYAELTKNFPNYQQILPLV